LHWQHLSPARPIPATAPPTATISPAPQTSTAINALAGNDIVDARGSGDIVDGFTGDDIIEGEEGNDINLMGAEDSDQVFGEDGADFIDLASNDTAGSEDRAFGGSDKDRIDAFDGRKDEVNCGGGKRDHVFFDKGLDQIENCENKHPNVSP
jgi:Ca2+-binding RTX toxin-like protein